MFGHVFGHYQLLTDKQIYLDAKETRYVTTPQARMSIFWDGASRTDHFSYVKTIT